MADKLLNSNLLTVNRGHTERVGALQLGQESYAVLLISYMSLVVSFNFSEF